MKTLVKKFGGAIFFYAVIVSMVMMVNYRFNKLNEINEGEQLAYISLDD